MPTIQAKAFHEVQNYINLTGHITDSLLTIVSGNLWGQLSDEDKEIFEQVFREAAANCTEDIRQSEADLVAWFEEQEGVDINEVDRTPFREATVALHNGPAATWPQEIYDRLAGDRVGPGAAAAAGVPGGLVPGRRPAAAAHRRRPGRLCRGPAAVLFDPPRRRPRAHRPPRAFPPPAPTPTEPRTARGRPTAPRRTARIPPPAGPTTPPAGAFHRPPDREGRAARRSRRRT